jgi:protein-disulfide isomerase
LIELKRLSKPVITERDHVQGSETSPVVLFEYGDFECPDSQYAFYVIKRLQKTLGNKLCFVFRNFPLEEHPHSLTAALAAESANAQGKYWEMYDLLFKNQDKLSNDFYYKCAKKVGLDINLFERDFENRIYIARINDDIRSGEESGVNGTPTLFVNGIMYEEAYDYDTLSTVLKNVASLR